MFCETRSVFAVIIGSTPLLLEAQALCPVADTANVNSVAMFSAECCIFLYIALCTTQMEFSYMACIQYFYKNSFKKVKMVFG